MLAHIIHDLALYRSLKEEVFSVMSDNELDVERIIQQCPLLDSTYHEALRFANAAGSIRAVLQPTEIGGKLFRPGRKVMMPYRQLHFNEDVYGPNVDHFDATRFMKNKDLSRSPHFRPFAGGTTFCPGRFMAKQETIAFVALALHRFDIEPAEMETTTADRSKITPRQPFPRFDEWKPTLGIMGPMEGDDYIIRVRQAAK